MEVRFNLGLDDDRSLVPVPVPSAAPSTVGRQAAILGAQAFDMRETWPSRRPVTVRTPTLPRAWDSRDDLPASDLRAVGRPWCKRAFARPARERRPLNYPRTNTRCDMCLGLARAGEVVLADRRCDEARCFARAGQSTHGRAPVLSPYRPVRERPHVSWFSTDHSRSLRQGLP